MDRHSISHPLDQSNKQLIDYRQRPTNGVAGSGVGKSTLLGMMTRLPRPMLSLSVLSANEVEKCASLLRRVWVLMDSSVLS